MDSTLMRYRIEVGNGTVYRVAQDSWDTVVHRITPNGSDRIFHARGFSVEDGKLRLIKGDNQLTELSPVVDFERY